MKRFHSSDFMQDKLSTLIVQLIKETLFLPPSEFLLAEFDCNCPCRGNHFHHTMINQFEV